MSEGGIVRSRLTRRSWCMTFLMAKSDVAVSWPPPDPGRDSGSSRLTRQRSSARCRTCSGGPGAGRPAGGAVSVRRAHKPPSPPHRGHDRDEHGRMTRDRHEPRALAPDLFGAWSVAEAPPPDEEVEGRVERADAQC